MTIPSPLQLLEALYSNQNELMKGLVATFLGRSLKQILIQKIAEDSSNPINIAKTPDVHELEISEVDL